MVTALAVMHFTLLRIMAGRVGALSKNFCGMVGASKVVAVMVERSHEATIVAAWCVLVADDEPVCCVLGYATDGWGRVESIHKFAQGVGA